MELTGIENIKVLDFVASKRYLVVLTPDSLVNFGFFRDDYRPYGHYSIADTEYSGITYNEQAINKMGFVIHDNKVCWSPRVVIFYNDGHKYTIICDTKEEAEKVKEQIVQKLPNYLDI